MSKTKPEYRKTKFGILSVEEIEVMITDGVVGTNAFLLREFEQLPINMSTAKELHEKIAGHIFVQAGDFRKTEVTVGNYQPPKSFQISQLMKDWESDYSERLKHLKNPDKQVELLAWMSSFIGIRRTDYADAMKKATFDNDLSDLVNLIKKSIE